ncbi:MAG: DUF6198 family protein [Oscillospiraceae bacterium]|nr:DUF6198 family protein [Oscillospiraceae bacterium]
MNKTKKIVTRLLFYVGGMMLVALGIRAAVRGGLGISPVSSPSRSVFNVIATHGWSLDLFGWHVNITYGMCYTAIFVLYLLLQILILRRKFQPVQLLQIAVSTLFGYFVDLAGLIVDAIPVPSAMPYWLQLIFLACSILLIPTGLTFYLAAKLIPMPSEGLVLAIQTARKEKKHDVPYHKVKVFVDSACVLSAILIVWLGTGHLTDIREGTVITAVMAGVVMGWLRPVLNPVIRKCGLGEE